MSKSEKRYVALDGLRGYFVLLIFFVHYTGRFVGWGETGTVLGKFLQWLQTSNYGVYGFFVLSGFLIGRLLINKKKISYPKYLLHRVYRIYPAFLIATIFSACIGIYYTKIMVWGWTTKLILQNLFFLNGFFLIGEVISYNFVTWSLFYEFLFYLVAPIAVVLANRFNARPAQLFVMYIVISVVAFSLGMVPSFLLFFAGLMVASFSDEELKAISQPIPDWLLLGFFVVANAGYSLGVVNHDLFLYSFGATMGLIIMKGCFGGGLLTRILTWNPLQRLGKISYSFYLLHTTVIVAYFHGVPKLFPDANPTLFPILSMLPVFALTWAMAWGLYQIAERPYFMFRGKHGIKKG